MIDRKVAVAMLEPFVSNTLPTDLSVLTATRCMIVAGYDWQSSLALSLIPPNVRLRITRKILDGAGFAVISGVPTQQLTNWCNDGRSKDDKLKAWDAAIHREKKLLGLI